jgi:hypothetical protein
MSGRLPEAGHHPASATATFDSHTGSKLERVIVASGGSESNPSSRRSSMQRYPSSKNYSYRDEDEEGTFVDTSETGSAAAVWIRFQNFMLELRREIVLEPRISLSKFIPCTASHTPTAGTRACPAGTCATAPCMRSTGDHKRQGTQPVLASYIRPWIDNREISGSEKQSNT